MGAVREVDALASHWVLLRESPLLPTVQGRAQSREAWHAAAAAYERSAQRAHTRAGEPSAKSSAARLQPHYPG